jgi:hypothetical protein
VLLVVVVAVAGIIELVQLDSLFVSRQDISHRNVTVVEHLDPILDEDLPEIGAQNMVVEPRLHLEGGVEERLVLLSKFLKGCEVNILPIQLLELGGHSERVSQTKEGLGAPNLFA